MRQEKTLHKEAITQLLEQNPSVIFMRYLGLKSNSANSFRRQMRKLGACVEVLPKRLLEKAAADHQLPLEQIDLSGHIGMVSGTGDPIEIAKFVKEFSKANNDALELIGGRVDGDVLNAAQMEQLTKLPGKPEMRAQFLATLAAPLSEVVGVLNALLGAVPNCLQAKSEQKS